MVDRENREDWMRERSLLALGQAVRDEDDAEASPVSIADRANPSWREDAATRHRLVRSHREARSNPAFAATAEASQSPSGQFPSGESPSDKSRAGDVLGSTARTPPQTVSHGLAGMLPGWLGGKRLTGSTADLPADRAVPGDRAQTVRQPDAAGDFGARRPPLEYAGADGEQRSSRENADGQEWKPLIDPMQVIGGIGKSKLLIVTTTILGAALGIAIALSTPKKYESTTELIVDPRDLKLTDRDLTQSVVASDATLAIVENQVRVLTSGTVLNKVVDKLNLVNDPEFNGQGRGGLGVMSLIRSILSRHDAQGPVDEARRRALAVGNLAESLSVERGGKTFVITVSAITQNGEKSALIANTMTDVFLQTFGQIQSDTAGRATDELTARLDELRKSVEAAERKVEDFRATHDLVDAQGHLISDDEMLKLNEQLSIARARTLELNARAASARSIDVNSVLSGTLPEEINSNTMSDLRSQYATLKQEADRAAIRLGPRHPEIQAINAQLVGARERIAGELRRIASSLQVDLKRAVQLEQDLASRLAQLKVRSGDVNSDLVTMRELEREASAKRSVYESYLLRAKETGEQKDINTANINVISKAFAPLEANGPSRAVVGLAGLLLGLASGIGLGAMRGAYESLREAADSRSRRKPAGRRTPVEDKAYQAPPPNPPVLPNPPALPGPPALPNPPVEVARAQPSGRVGALLSAVRKAMPGKAPEENYTNTRSVESVSPVVAESEQPMEDPMYPVYAEPNSPLAPQQPMAAGHPQPLYQQGFHAAHPQQMVPPPMVHPMMPQQAMYPAPHMQPYPYAQQMGYPQLQPWQMQPPPGYPYPQAMAPYAGPVPYPQQPAPLPQAAYPKASLAEAPLASEAVETQTPIEEIRASLREFREAVRELTESRTRRRYF